MASLRKTLLSLIYGLSVASVMGAQSSTRHAVPAPQWSDSLKLSGRTSPPFVLAVLWSRAGDIADTVLLQPGSMIADGNALWVIDYSPPRAVALDVANGITKRVVGKFGRGPGEWVGPLQFAGRRGGEIGVFDPGTRRISWMSTRGAGLRQESLTGVPSVTHVCAPSDEIRLAAVLARGNSTQLARASGTPTPSVITRELPWLSLRSVPAIASQVFVRPLGDGCAVFPLYGSGVARYAAAGSLNDTVHLVEQVPLAKVEERQVAQGRSFSIASGSIHGVIDAARFGQYLVVAFGGRSAQRERLLDFYDWATRRYVGSLKTALDVRYVTATTSTLYVQMADDEGLYRLHALTIAGPASRR